MIEYFDKIQNKIFPYSDNLTEDEQEEENKKLQEKEKEMLKRIDNLKDPAEIEKITREVLNMRKPEEEIYRIIKN